MKVLMILTNGFAPDLRVYKEAKYIYGCGYDVEILCWDRDGKYIDKPVENFGNIKITRFYEKSEYGSGLKQIFKLLKFKNTCKKYIKKLQYDYIHCHDLDGMLVGYLISNKRDKIIFDMHEFYNSGSYAKIYFLIKRLIHMLQNRSYKIIHVNQKQIEDVSNKNRDKLIYLPNYPEIKDFSDVQHIQSKILRVTYVGYIRHLIPITNLINAAGNLDGIRISLHGSGEILNEVTKISHNYENINITGKFKHEEISKFYSDSDVMYIVYNKGNKNDESALPTKFFEAIISGIPVIVAKDSLLQRTVEKYNIGFCVDGTNQQEIRNLLVELRDNKELLEEKQKNIKKIKGNFIWEEVVKNLDNIYRVEEE